ncbi:MAG: AraC family transcriptional regulator [Phenylobacterium sp.]|nr:AraC family transcriptional regulator [Phenylobacterium sp.]
MSELGRSAALTGFREVARDVGIDAEALADEVGLPLEALSSPDLRVATRAMGRMLQLAAERSGRDDFALRMAERRGLSNLGPVGLVVREQPTLRKALHAFQRFIWFHSDAYSLDMQLSGDQFILKVNGPARMHRQSADLVVATTVRTIRAVMREGWKPQEVWFVHGPPARLDTYRRVLGVTPVFDQPHLAVVMPRGELDTPIPTADPEMARQLAAYLESLTRQRTARLSDKVCDLILTLLPDGEGSVERVAARLGMDRRTLHRRLSAEGVTFSGLLERTRRDLARSLLINSDRPLYSVADLLGFSSLSAFAHWFRRAFHQSASAYRAEHAGTRRPADGLAPVA